MQVTGVQGAEEKPPGTRRGAAYIGMDTAIFADMGQNNPMADLHAVHVPGQVEIIQMNPLSSFFSGVPASSSLLRSNEQEPPQSAPRQTVTTTKEAPKAGTKTGTKPRQDYRTDPVPPDHHR